MLGSRLGSDYGLKLSLSYVRLKLSNILVSTQLQKRYFVECLLMSMSSAKHLKGVLKTKNNIVMLYFCHIFTPNRDFNITSFNYFFFRQQVEDKGKCLHFKVKKTLDAQSNTA